MITRRQPPVKQNPQSFLHCRKIAENRRKTQKRCNLNLLMGCGFKLPQSKPNGFASSLGEGAFDMAGRFLVALDTLALRAAACALSVTCGDTSPKGRGSGETASYVVCPETLPLCQGLSLWESWQARQGLTERARTLPTIFIPFFHKHFGRCGKTARRVYLFAQKRGKINCKIRKCALRQVCRAGRTSTAHP